MATLETAGETAGVDRGSPDQSRAQSGGPWTTLSLWLEQQGMDLRGCEIRPSGATDGAGLGVFAPPSTVQRMAIDPAGEIETVLATAPLSIAITPATLLRHPQLGKFFERVIEGGEVDDRTAVILFLMLEGARGAESEWAGFFRALPREFTNSLSFTERELSLLEGTVLHAATCSKRRLLVHQFESAVQPLAADGLQILGLEAPCPSLEDFVWAYNIFWSRALSIPLPRSALFPETSDVLTLEGTSGGPTVERRAIPSGEEEGEEAFWAEGLLPGIDFCNHDPGAVVRWGVDNAAGEVTGRPHHLYLATGPGVQLASGQEIFINYGGKSNESLLFMYGFCLPDNPDDTIMIHFPLGALEEDPCADAKQQLLEAQNLDLRWLFPVPSPSATKGAATLAETRTLSETRTQASASVRVPECESSCTAAAASQEHQSGAGPSCHSVSGGGQSGESASTAAPSGLVATSGEGAEAWVEASVLQALRVLAASEDQVYEIAGALQEEVEAGDGSPPAPEAVAAVVERVCGSMNATMLLRDLLLEKLTSLEETTRGEGPDQDLLQAEQTRAEGTAETSRNLDDAEVAQRTGLHPVDLCWPAVVCRESEGVSRVRGGGEPREPVQHACLLYRATQKTVVRQWLGVVEGRLCALE